MFSAIAAPLLSGDAADSVIAAEVSKPSLSRGKPGILRVRACDPRSVLLDYGTGEWQPTPCLSFLHSESLFDRGRARAAVWRPKVLVMRHALERAAERSGGINGIEDMLAFLDGVAPHAALWSELIGTTSAAHPGDLEGRGADRPRRNEAVHIPVPGGALVGQVFRARDPAMHLASCMVGREPAICPRNSAVAECVVLATYLDEALLERPVREALDGMRSLVPVDWTSERFLSGLHGPFPGEVRAGKDEARADAFADLALCVARHAPQGQGHLRYDLGTLRQAVDLGYGDPIYAPGDIVRPEDALVALLGGDDALARAARGVFGDRAAILGPPPSAEQAMDVEAEPPAHRFPAP